MASGKRKSTQKELIEIDTVISSDDDHDGNHPIQQTSSNIAPASAQQSNNSGLDLKSKPLHAEVTYIGGVKPGGARTWICKHCKNQFTSTYTRIHNHFFPPESGKAGISLCTLPAKDRKAYGELRSRVAIAEETGASSSLKASRIAAKKQKAGDNKIIENCFRELDRDDVDLKVVRALCANGIPFNVLRNPHFIEMTNALKKAPKDYKMPSFEKARSSLLDKCKNSVDKELISVKETWYRQGVSIVSDGWSNVKSKPLINVLAVNSRGGMFMYADDFSGIEKTGGEIALYLLRAIKEIGDNHVLQVVTDNASNCKAAGKAIEEVHKHIFWSPCVVHTLNLMFKDFAGSFSWMQDTYKKGKDIVKYVLNHSQVLAYFRTQSKLELLQVAKTRFASHYVLLRRLLNCKEHLICTVAMRQWKDWAKRGDANMRKTAAEVSDTIKNEEFWEEVKNVVKITRPIYLLLRFSDGDGEKMGEIYKKMDNMLGEIRDIMMTNKHGDDYPYMEEIILARWGKMNVPLHCLAFALNPLFYDSQYLSSPAPGGIARTAPNLDAKVVTGVMEAFKKIASNEAEETLLRKQWASFHMKEGLYGLVAAQADAATMSSIAWWSNYGAQTPELAEVAKKVLSQPISSSSAERNWSTYQYIHSSKRNRLNCDTADKLVFIHYNLRVLSRFSETYASGPCKHWDVDPESANLESQTRLEDLRWRDLEDEIEDDD